MNKCRYATGNCVLLKSVGVRVNVSGDWCPDRCWSNHVPAQIAMLRRLGIELPALPEDKDLLEWMEECVADETVKLSDVAEKARQRKKEAEEKRRQLLAEMPSGFKLAKNLMKHLVEIHRYYKKTGKDKVEKGHEKARLDICRACPDEKMAIDDDDVMRCTLPSCGCCLDNPKGRPILGGRAEYWALPCDNGHWDEVDEKFTNEQCSSPAITTAGAGDEPADPSVAAERPNGKRREFWMDRIDYRHRKEIK